MNDNDPLRSLSPPAGGIIREKPGTDAPDRQTRGTAHGRAHHRSPGARRLYKWFYNNIHSRQYDLSLKWILWPFGGEKRFRDGLLGPVQFSASDRILDMCCGTGGCTLAIREKAGPGAVIIGCDLSYGQIRAAERKNNFGNVSFFVADACRTGLEDGQFDKVFVTHALHEMPRGDRLAVLAEARRLIRQGGSLVVLELARPQSRAVRLLQGFWLGYWIPWPINFENRTRRDMLAHGVADEAREVGFKDAKTTLEFHGMTQVVIAERRDLTE